MDRINPKKLKYKVVSLFSGIGGLDLGFEYNGFDIIWANDYDKFAVQTYKENVGNQIVGGDIRLEMSNIPNHDVLIGGFPCQPFSTLGKLRGFEDERGTLFFAVKEVIKAHCPKVVVLENVKNLKSHDKGRTFSTMTHELESLGYEVKHKVLNSLDFGVPQRRNRVFIVAFKKDSFNSFSFDFPEGEKCKLSALYLLDKDVEPKYFISKKMIKTIMSKGTKGFMAKPTIDTDVAKPLTATMHKYHRASQDNYYTDEYNWNKHKDSNKSKIRKLTPNEVRKLQGFPKKWNHIVSNTQVYRQFGNAVTVNVAYELAKNIRLYIEKHNKVIKGEERE
jgi:DNA (cytosine-5)-methyltransferase 1